MLECSVVFEANRPIFFISDRDDFLFTENPVEDIIAANSTTLSLMCLPNSEDLMNKLFVHYNSSIEDNNIEDNSEIFLAYHGDIKTPSKVISIFESDNEIFYEQKVAHNVVNLKVYINKDYAELGAPNTFHVYISDEKDN